MSEEEKKKWSDAATFLFGIGDCVSHKSRKITSMVVIQRGIHECHGGMQREYVCSYFDNSGEHIQNVFNESCLVAYSPLASVEEITRRVKDLASRATPDDVKKVGDKE